MSGLRSMIAIVFLSALIPRLAISMTAPHGPSDHWDVAHDVVIARNLAQGNGFANEPGHPTAYRYPLVPVVLSVFFRILGERYIPFLLFQSFLSALVAPVIACMGAAACGRRLGLVSGLLVAFDSELISFSRMMLSETIFSFLLAVVALVFIGIVRRGGWLQSLLAGFLLGLAILCRPVALAWGVLLAVALILTKGLTAGRRAVSILLLVAGCMATVAPWLIRNRIVMGTFLFSTSSGVTLWLFGHNDAELAGPETVVPEEFVTVNRTVDPKGYFSGSGGDPARIVPIFNMEPCYQVYFYEQSAVNRVAGLNEVEADMELSRMALEYMKAHPLATLAHSAGSLMKTLAYTEMNGRMNILLTLVMPFLLLGVFVLARASWEISIPVMSCLLSMLAVNFLFCFLHRYRVPYQPFIMLVGAAGLLRLFEGNLSSRERVLLFCWMPVPVVVNYFLLRGSQ